MLPEFTVLKLKTTIKFAIRNGINHNEYTPISRHDNATHVHQLE